jgi:hypothetical protein
MYVRRQPEGTVLHHLVRERLRGGGGEGLPGFVERELRGFLSCGALAHG